MSGGGAQRWLVSVVMGLLLGCRLWWAFERAEGSLVLLAVSFGLEASKAAVGAYKALALASVR